MTDQKTEPRLPKMGEFVKGLGTVVEIRDVTPPPPPKAEHYVFATVKYYMVGRINGKPVIMGDVWADLEPGKEDARRKAGHLGPSDMVFVVVQTTRHEVKAAGPGCHHADAEFCRLGDPKGAYEAPGLTADKDVWEYRLTADGPAEKDLTEEA